ncbi:MAG: hypothetical protein ACI35S_03435 [Anaeroplasma sp.]
MKKNIWKHLKMLPVIIYPYLYMVAFLIILIVGIIEDNITHDSEYTMLAMVLTILLALVVTVVCFIISVINSIRSSLNSYGVYYPTRMNLIIKCIQIPAYIINFIVGMIGILMSLWGIGFIALAVVVDFLTITITGTNNIGTCINACKNNYLTKGKAWLFVFLSYIYVIDVIVAIYLFFKVRKNKINEIINNNN